MLSVLQAVSGSLVNGGAPEVPVDVLAVATDVEPVWVQSGCRDQPGLIGRSTMGASPSTT